MLEGGCHCGAVRYELEGEPMHHALCHCTDCRRHAGAPMVGWMMFKTDQFRVTLGEAREYASSEHGRRYFCADCGTGLYYINAEMLPGITDVQSGTLDDPEAIAPQVQIQTADRIGWMKTAHALPEFERYPGP
jgi:hypothetical protein